MVFLHSFLGSVLVNCQKGLSRSSTCVLAFLMLKRNMTAVAALAMVTYIHKNFVKEWTYKLKYMKFNAI